MFYDILDNERKNILPKLSFLKDRFYLAGGTALALQFGHRDSVDFDFFSEKDFDTVGLYNELSEIFGKDTVIKVMEEKNTLYVFIDEKIKLSFISYQYPLLENLIQDEFLNIAHFIDIGCMKLSAIVSRAVEKDYVDLFFIFKKISLKELLAKAKEKMPTLDTNLILKSLVYFDDIEKEKINFKHNFEVSFDEIKDFISNEVKNSVL